MVAKLPGFFIRDKKESKEFKLAKSITSIQNSSRKKIGSPRKSSIESGVPVGRSLQNLDEKVYDSPRKRSIIEKSQIISATHSRIDFHKKTNDVFIPITQNQSKLLEED
ncbi:MAG: hypothetical protein EOP04_28595 [Proteobacteria bacterium]|nr:MAG: hypothetical protein EOP04_28595 [Pseudomonadota bacterium]